MLSTVALLAGCAYPIRNDAVVQTGRPAYDWKSLPPGEMQDTLVIVTMSGGGTRATALAMSVLRAMDKIKLASGASLADEIDIVSSVSGGSVTAGYFALYGAAGLPTLEKDFVRQDGMRAIIVEGLNPVGLAQLHKVMPQIDPAALAGKLEAEKVMSLFTVDNLVDMVEQRVSVSAA